MDLVARDLRGSPSPWSALRSSGEVWPTQSYVGGSLALSVSSVSLRLSDLPLPEALPTDTPTRPLLFHSLGCLPASRQ